MEEALIEKSRTTVHYVYDVNAQLVQETRIRSELEIEEHKTPSDYEDITSWQMVGHDEVNGLLASGWEIRQHWQKNVLMVLREVNECE